MFVGECKQLLLISPQWRKSYGTHTKFQLEQVLHEWLCKPAVLIHLTSTTKNMAITIFMHLVLRRSEVKIVVLS